ncbi:GntR family transcriptional regulator [Paramicrobacterium chengjingii]|uniref:GntR family transcriptional regulator n=1 Tax=Paramicrobacterium chengjingii TaxID=2769067 RepID=A0ABX6YJ76_9MICO|nr:GntR family transcriptional regulator [Microbacterium chengjingii]QPZ38415.1 GntR family transcriptional regulator [Microbacterium chengjingii]
MPRSVYDRLRADIISGEFMPGDGLGETALGKRYGTSRTPIREALHRLELDLLVERTPRGMQVKGSTPEEILDIYEVRIDLEGLAARAAAKRRTDLDLARIHAARDEMSNLADAELRADTNRGFHESIWAASHNQTLIDQLERLSVHLLRYPTTTLSVEDRWESALSEHDELISAIADRDSDAAEQIAEQHMSRARDIRLQLYAQQR